MEEKRKAHCPNCNEDTTQIVTEYDPDKPDLMLVWECEKCHEMVDIVFA